MSLIHYLFPSTKKENNHPPTAHTHTQSQNYILFGMAACAISSNAGGCVITIYQIVQMRNPGIIRASPFLPPSIMPKHTPLLHFFQSLLHQDQGPTAFLPGLRVPK